MNTSIEHMKIVKIDLRLSSQSDRMIIIYEFQTNFVFKYLHDVSTYINIIAHARCARMIENKHNVQDAGTSILASYSKCLLFASQDILLKGDAGH